MACSEQDDLTTFYLRYSSPCNCCMIYLAFTVSHAFCCQSLANALGVTFPAITSVRSCQG